MRKTGLPFRNGQNKIKGVIFYEKENSGGSFIAHNGGFGRFVRKLE